MAIEKISKEFTSKLEKFKKPEKNVSREFQIYGYELAEKLDDLQHKALYIKLSKDVPRATLEKAYSFAIDYPQAKSKAKIFMYKLRELRKGQDTQADDKAADQAAQNSLFSGK